MTNEYWTPGFELMLEEARRSIDRQSERVHNVRDRAIGLVGFGSIVAASFGFVGDRALDTTGYVAALAFVLVAGAALFVLFPRKFHFELSATRIDAWFDDRHTQRLGPDHMLYSTAMSHQANHTYNYAKLARMQTSIAIGVAALAVESLALLARLVLK
ncbi:hypothetical protein [Nocardioides caldifontis]|uniref:hypothetical protein n=1 Tax=Nocardioides caldifontis TaxID=2588938 RepID=UPI0011E00BC2|nr:hypothetical protein [Nocardioides caldifontis]